MKSIKYLLEIDIDGELVPIDDSFPSAYNITDKDICQGMIWGLEIVEQLEE